MRKQARLQIKWVMIYFDENDIYPFGLNHMVQHRQQLYLYHLSDIIDGQEPCIYQNSKILNDNTSVKSNKDLFKAERNSILILNCCTTPVIV